MSIVNLIDVRNWDWRWYASLSTVAIVALVILKAWIERDA
jgi:hypothetical protein